MRIDRILIVGIALILLLSGCSEDNSKCTANSARVFEQVGGASVSGSAAYEDKRYDNTGVVGQTVKSISIAVVDLLDGCGLILDTTTTDSSGNYSFSGVTHENISVRILTMTDSLSGRDFTVRNHASAIYSIKKDLVVTSQTVTNHNLLATIADGAAGAFNIFDVISMSADYVDAAIPSGISWSSIPLKVYWQTSNPKGTYYCWPGPVDSFCFNGGGIYIGFSPSDTDEFDDDVVIHEFFHYLESQAGLSDSPGGTHFLSDLDQDMRLAWSEGFGAAFPALVKVWQAGINPTRLSAIQPVYNSYYIDTVLDSVNIPVFGISVDLTNPVWPGATFKYVTNEMAVAHAAYTLLDYHIQQGALKDPNETIMEILSLYLPSVTARPDSFEIFWDGLVDSAYQSELAESNLATQLIARDIFYLEDVPEPTSGVPKSCGTITACNGQYHLYLSPPSSGLDADYFEFALSSGVSYTFTVSSTINGADPALRLLNSGAGVEQSTVDSSHINSGVETFGFTPSSTDTYTLEVSVSSGVPASMGRYGSYTLTVTQP